MRVPESPAFNQLQSFTLASWLYPTTSDAGVAGLLGTWSGAESSGFALVIDETGALAIWLGGSRGEVVRVSSGAALRAGAWYFAAASYDAELGRVLLVQRPTPAWPLDPSNADVEQAVPPRAVGATHGPFLMAALRDGGVGGAPLTSAHFNGKLEAPCLFGAALDHVELNALGRGEPPASFRQPLVAAWDFSRDPSSTRVTDVSPAGLHGETVQTPARAMTGHAWSGQEMNYARAPGEYGAIHFHDDDLTDAGWHADFTLTVPDDLPSGVYAAKLSGEDAQDYVPFFVRPRGRKAAAEILLVMPTNSYLAYGNEHVMASPEVQLLLDHTIEYPVQEQDKYIVAHRLLSLYDHHSDGSGVCYSSRLRPIVNMRPAWNFTLLGNGEGYPHQFNADLHLVDWLTTMGFQFDVAIDEDLHNEGEGLLSHYRVVLTGSHHEYWSAAMLAALDSYLANGGRCMYLSGNGLYWVTSFDPEQPHIVEVRRWGGTQSWTAEPGQYYHSTTGELGGLWRERARAPQKLVGVGFTAQGVRPLASVSASASQFRSARRVHLRRYRPRRADRRLRTRDGGRGWLRARSRRHRPRDAAARAGGCHGDWILRLVPARGRGGRPFKLASGRVSRTARQGRHGLLRDAERWGGVLGRLNRLLRQSVGGRLRWQRIAPHRKCAAALPIP